ncbi:hypothetical protein [Fischerella sp. PCC 9605]|uniref:hypothetical protein n=1 Tax=Fischerella sp. PCC 9605 TaxID=1173024 RepID=UPI0004B01F75|nr:hypothetical protein [Fischerella sp. PCC 9605]
MPTEALIGGNLRTLTGSRYRAYKLLSALKKVKIGEAIALIEDTRKTEENGSFPQLTGGGYFIPIFPALASFRTKPFQ